MEAVEGDFFKVKLKGKNLRYILKKICACHTPVHNPFVNREFL
jgi:hypothetical protein